MVTWTLLLIHLLLALQSPFWSSYLWILDNQFGRYLTDIKEELKWQTYKKHNKNNKTEKSLSLSEIWHYRHSTMWASVKLFLMTIIQDDSSFFANCPCSVSLSFRITLYGTIDVGLETKINTTPFQALSSAQALMNVISWKLHTNLFMLIKLVTLNWQQSTHLDEWSIYNLDLNASLMSGALSLCSCCMKLIIIRSSARSR